LAQPNDIILIAGKGHETYQELMGASRFDDMKIVKRY
jgi:UDP-N-acetylmuramoyl-L-alanyl-D-glutamate--2,6-diaminopimelate ligase